MPRASAFPVSALLPLASRRPDSRLETVFPRSVAHGTHARDLDSVLSFPFTVCSYGYLSLSTLWQLFGCSIEPRSTFAICAAPMWPTPWLIRAKSTSPLPAAYALPSAATMPSRQGGDR